MTFEYNSVLSKAGAAAQDAYLDKKGLTAAERAVELMRFGRAAEAVDLLRTLHMNQFEIGQTIGPDAAAQFAQEQEKDESNSALYLRLANEAREAHAAVGASPMLASYAASLQADPASLAKDFAKLDGETAAQAVDRLLNSGQSAEKIAAALKSLGFSDERIKTMVAGYSDHGRSLVAASLSFDHSMAKLAAVAAERAAESKRRSFEAREEAKADREEDESKAEAKAQRVEQAKIQQEAAKLSAEARESFYELVHALGSEGTVEQLADATEKLMKPGKANEQAIDAAVAAKTLDAEVGKTMKRMADPKVDQEFRQRASQLAQDPRQADNLVTAAKALTVMQTAEERHDSKMADAQKKTVNKCFENWKKAHPDGTYAQFEQWMKITNGTENSFQEKNTAEAKSLHQQGLFTDAQLQNQERSEAGVKKASARLLTGEYIQTSEMQQIAQGAASANRKALEEKARVQLNSFAQQYAQSIDLAQALSQDKKQSLQTLSNLVASGAMSAETAEILRQQSEILQRANQRLQAANSSPVQPAAVQPPAAPGASETLQAVRPAASPAESAAAQPQTATPQASQPAKLTREDLPQYVAEFSASSQMISAIQAAADAEKRPLTADENRRIAEYEKTFLRVDTLGNQEDQRRFTTMLSIVSFSSGLDEAKANPKTTPAELAVLEKNYKQALEAARSQGITQSELDSAAAAYAKQKEQTAQATQSMPKQQPASELLAAQNQHELDLDGPPVSLISNAARMQKDLAAAGQTIARPPYMDDIEMRRSMVENKIISAGFSQAISESAATAGLNPNSAKEAFAKAGIANPTDEQQKAMQEFARAAYLSASVAYDQKYGKFDKIMAADDASAKAEVERTVQNLRKAGIQIDSASALQAAADAYERDLKAGIVDSATFATPGAGDQRNAVPDTLQAALASAKPVLSAAPQAEAKPAVLGEEARVAALSSIAGKLYTSCQPGYVDLADDPHFSDLKALLVKAQVNAKPSDDALATSSVAEAITGLIQHGKMTPEEYQSLASAAKADKGFTVTNDQASAIIAWSSDPAANKSVSQSNAPAADAAAKAEKAAVPAAQQAAAVPNSPAPSKPAAPAAAPTASKAVAYAAQETGPAFYARLQASLPAGSELAADIQASKDRKSFTLRSDPQQRKFEMSVAGVGECSKTLSDKAKKDLAAAQAQFDRTVDIGASALKFAEVDAAAQKSKTASADEKAKFHQVHELRERELAQAQAANISANRAYAASARESEQMSEVASLIMHGQGAELAKRLSASSAKPASPAAQAAPASETLGAMPSAQPAPARKPTDFSVPRTIVATPAKAPENKPIPVVYTGATPLAAPPINKSKLKAHGGAAHAPVSGLDQAHPKFQTNFDAFRKGIAENYDAYRKDHPVNEDECNALFSDSIRQMRDILNKNPEYVAAHTQSSRLRIESETSPKPGVDYQALIKQAAQDEERAKDKVFDAAGENGMAGLRAQQIMAMNLRDALGAMRSGDKARAAEILLNGSRGELSEEASKGVKSAMIDVLLHQDDPEIKKLYTPGQIALLKDYFKASLDSGAISQEEMVSISKDLATSASINPQTRNLLNQIKADTKANMETMAGLNTEHLGSAPAQTAKADAIPSVEKVPEKIQQTRDAKAEDAAKAEAAGPAAPVPGA